MSKTLPAALLVVVLSMLGCSAAAAQSDLTLDAGLATDVPLLLGGRVQLKNPESFRLSLGVGFLPGPYLDIINGAAVAIASDSGYTDADAEVVREALANSLVVRIHGGWQLTKNLYIDVGYGFVGLGGGVTGQDLLILATGFEADDFPGGVADEFTYDVDCTLHMVDLEVGWEWDMDPWVLRAAGGVSVTVASNTNLEPTGQSTEQPPALTEALTTFAEAYLDDLFTSYVHSPTLSFSASYRFF